MASPTTPSSGRFIALASPTSRPTAAHRADATQPTPVPPDTPGHAQRAVWWFRKGPPPAWVVNAKPYVETVDADARIPRRQRRSLLELNDETCSWPVGDPRSSRFFFCGAQPLRNRPYCAEHSARAARRPWRRRHPIRVGDETTVQHLSTGERG